MKRPSKFLELCETVLTRNERAGFLVGDQVEIVNFNKLSAEIRDGLKELINNGVNIKVVDIVNKYPSDKPGSQLNNSGDVVLVVSADYGGGRYVGRFIVDPGCCKRIDNYPNLDTIPDALKRKNTITIKPEPVDGYENEEFTSQTNKSDTGSGLTRGDRALHQQNVGLPGAKGATSYKPKF